MKNRTPLVVLALGLLAAPAFGQGTKDDYERAFSLGERFADMLTHDRVEPHWVSDAEFWFEANLGGGEKELRLVNAETGETTGSADPAVKEKEEKKPAQRRDREPWPEGGRPSDSSPDERWKLELRLGALVLIDTESGNQETTLAPAPSREGAYNGRAGSRWIHRGIRGMGRRREDGRQSVQASWAPDSKHFVVWETVPGDHRMIHLVESSPRDQLQPKTHEYQYDKPGDAIEWRRPHLFSVESGEEVAIEGDPFTTPWSVDRLRWKPDGSAFTLVYNRRGHQLLRVLEIDTAGHCRTLIEESFPTFVHYSGTGKCWLYRLDDTDEALWTSERDGWNHLYLVDLKSGEVKQQITRGPWVVRDVEHIDAEKRRVWFYAGGVVAGQDPYYKHLCRVDFDGSNFRVLTDGEGTHRVSWSPDGGYFLDTYSRVDLPPVVELRRADGSLVCEVERADATALEAAGWRAPERFIAKGRDGKTDIYGVVCRPTNFDPSKKYPVVEEHYAGPHSAHCPKSFRTLYPSQSMAELGFILVYVDGMGTDHRGKAFHDVCWQNLVDAGLPDRIAWTRALAEHEPAIDIERVGIRGTSAGGQTSTAAVLHHGDFYKAAVSNCGCHDNRTDKVWWNEQWMGWPIGRHYHEQSNVTNAHLLESELMLVVGEMDRNVPATATLQVVDALIRADKDFELLFVTGAGHGARHPTNGSYTQRRTWDFFVRKLHGVEPRRD